MCHRRQGISQDGAYIWQDSQCRTIGQHLDAAVIAVVALRIGPWHPLSDLSDVTGVDKVIDYFASSCRGEHQISDCAPAHCQHNIGGIKVLQAFDP